MPRKMTKAEALKDFRENIAPEIRKRYGRGDSIAMREAWSDYTDMLCKDRMITNKQYDTWDNPF